MSDILSLDSLTQLDNGFEDGMFYIENPKSGYICSANQSPLKTDNDAEDSIKMDFIIIMIIQDPQE